MSEAVEIERTDLLLAGAGAICVVATSVLALTGDAGVPPVVRVAGALALAGLGLACLAWRRLLGDHRNP